MLERHRYKSGAWVQADLSMPSGSSRSPCSSGPLIRDPCNSQDETRHSGSAWSRRRRRSHCPDVEAGRRGKVLVPSESEVFTGVHLTRQPPARGPAPPLRPGHTAHGTACCLGTRTPRTWSTSPAACESGGCLEPQRDRAPRAFRDLEKKDLEVQGC